MTVRMRCAGMILALGAGLALMLTGGTQVQGRGGGGAGGGGGGAGGRGGFGGRGGLLPIPPVVMPPRYVTTARSEITNLPAAPLVPRTREDLKAIQARVEAVVKSVLPAVVGIQTQGHQGTGVLVSPDGYILTAGHVSGTAGAPVHIFLGDDTSPESEMNAVALGANRDIDSGMIKMRNFVGGPGSAGGFTFVPLGSSNGLAVGQWVVALGHSGGYQKGRPPLVRLGRVLAVERERGFIETDCPLIFGDSGGPLFDLDGRLIGINSRIGESTDTNLHTPVNTFFDTWERLASGQQWGARGGRAATGPGVAGGGAAARGGGTMASVVPMVPAARLGVVPGESEKGVMVNGIAAGTPAEQSDLRVGDILIKVDGRAIRSREELTELVSQHKPGDSIAIEYLRNTETRRVNVTLAAQPRK